MVRAVNCLSVSGQQPPLENALYLISLQHIWAYADKLVTAEAPAGFM